MVHGCVPQHQCHCSGRLYTARQWRDGTRRQCTVLPASLYVVCGRWRDMGSCGEVILHRSHLRSQARSNLGRSSQTGSASLHQSKVASEPYFTWIGEVRGSRAPLSTAFWLLQLQGASEAHQSPSPPEERVLCSRNQPVLKLVRARLQYLSRV